MTGEQREKIAAAFIAHQTASEFKRRESRRMTGEQRETIAVAIGMLRTAAAVLMDKDRDCLSSEMTNMAVRLEELIEKDECIIGPVTSRNDPGDD